jgi:hypothetical protein
MCVSYAACRANMFRALGITKLGDRLVNDVPKNKVTSSYLVGYHTEPERVEIKAGHKINPLTSVASAC